MVFISNEKHFALALQNGVSVLVIPSQFKDKALPFITTQTLLLSPNVTLAMALVIDKFFNPPYPKLENPIHTTAQVHKSAKLGKNVEIGAYCVIGQNVEIGENTKIHSHVVIEHDVKVGTNTVIFPYVFLGHGTQIGNFCEIKPHATIGTEGYGFAHDEKGRHYRIPQRGIVVIEDYVSIGAQCTIDRATFEITKIGEGTKMDNMIHVAHNSKLGKHGLYAGGSVIAGSAKIGDHVTVGGHSSIGGHLEITDNVQISGKSGVPSGISKSGIYGGHPIEPLKDHLRTQVSLKKLTQGLRDLKKVMKHLNITSDKE
jgi:UDP-3-O-[3-hydroxymyristoyl] glucosamine N-acyltransferase